MLAVRVAVALALLAGCSTSDGWVKPGMTKEELGQDTASCMLNSHIVVPSREGPLNTIDQDRYRRCMANKGYTAAPSK